MHGRSEVLITINSLINHLNKFQKQPFVDTVQYVFLKFLQNLQEKTYAGVS